MDLVFPDFLHIAVALLCISLSLVLFLLYGRKSSNIKLPPGKAGWPIIGEMWEYVMDCRRGDLEKFVLNRMNKYSPDVFQTSLLGNNVAMLCGPSGNKLMFSSEDKHVTPFWPISIKDVMYEPGTVVGCWKEETAKLTRFLPEFLKTEALQRYVPIMDSMAKAHLEADWIPHKQVKVFPLLRKYTFDISCKLFMGIEDSELVARILSHFHSISDALLSLPLNFPGTTYNRGVNGGKMLRKELRTIIEQRKRELFSEKKEPPVIDLLTRMLLSSKDENTKTVITDDDITRKMPHLLLASYDTSNAAMTSVIYYLSHYPDVYTKVLNEQRGIAESKAPGELLTWEDVLKMKYSWCVIREAMRIKPPVAVGGMREAITDIYYAGFTIPKGWKVGWIPHSTHNNPKYFPDPEKFDPSRFEGKAPAPYTYVPFGGGPRMCPGMEYARFEMLIFLHNVVTKFKWEKVIPDEKIIYTSFLIPENGLPVLLQPHGSQLPAMAKINNA